VKYVVESLSWEANSCLGYQEIPVSYRTRKFITVFTRDSHVFLTLRQINPISTIKVAGSSISNNSRTVRRIFIKFGIIEFYYDLSICSKFGPDPARMTDTSRDGLHVFPHLSNSLNIYPCEKCYE
jgi:hypothetical protein